MAEKFFDLTTDEGKQAFYAHCDKFDYDLHVQIVKEQRLKNKIKRKKRALNKKIMESKEFIRASKKNPGKFDSKLFKQMWDHFAKQDPFLSQAPLAFST